MREIDARVVGFDYTTFHAYTTEVDVGGCTWTLAIRYNTFYQFYLRLVALEKHFTVDFPPKGGLFFSPPPEERQEQLDDFLLSTLAYFDMRGHPKRMEALLGELLQIPEHLGVKDDDGEHTASEGSSVAEELLLDTPIAGYDGHDSFLESGHEDEDENVHESNFTLQEGNKVDVEVNVETNQSNPQEAEVAVEEDYDNEEVLEEKKSEVPKQLVDKVMTSPKSTKPMQRQQSHELSGGAVAKDYIAMLRRRSLVNGAMQAAVVSTMKENVAHSKTATETEIKPAEGDKLDPGSHEQDAPAEVEEQPTALIMEDDLAAPEELHTEAILAEPPTTETPVSALEVGKAVEPVVSIQNPIDPDLEKTLTSERVQATFTQESAAVSASKDPELLASTQEEIVQEEESFSEEESEKITPEGSNKEIESENSLVGWFRRLGTFGPSSTEKEEQQAVAKKEQEELEAATMEHVEILTAPTKEQEQVVARAATEAKAKSEAEAEALEAELLRAEQELNQRLQPYRHPVFFQGFNCDVGTSRYSLPQRVSDGVVV
ncbi:Hypothetical protein PHPALM_12922 [Phytophthora palmivora]|uniref:PX domain-containing protein n=1 Tax=Phytophthora palmivora TaxID=4796 RepID=A0A2P4XYH3_9STRA|nr:Hypothetical protein PHPALM_12922 [Phytophthora palmivora]